ncbi:unnamed protein product [Symbiodinium microadriaticum]|nr:unnamed protein product [Symbiodinium microadriaticum]
MKRNSPETEEMNSKMPQKKYYRSRAHCNPLSHNNGFVYPTAPDRMDWTPFYPNIPDAMVKCLDIGCGFGGLTVALAGLHPDKCILGLEIRAKVCEYVRLRIEALREETGGASYQNASCFRTNCMRYLPNYFRKGQLEKIFICFPDPHFKAKNHRRRIISEAMLSEYAFLLEENGRLYTATDVEELHQWHVDKCSSHVCFERLDDDDVFQSDPAVNAMITETEEGKKVERMHGKKYFAVFRRRTEVEISALCAERAPVLSLCG